jgi:hypothetical protein
MCTSAQPATLTEVYHRGISTKGAHVLSTLILILVVLWLLGIGTSYTLGGFIHILLAVAIIAVLIRVIQGRNPLKG